MTMICVCNQEYGGSHYPFHCSCGRTWSEAGVQSGTDCIYLGPATGETLRCRTCGIGVVEVPVRLCDIHGETLERKYTPAGGRVWTGSICLTCEDRRHGSDHNNSW